MLILLCGKMGAGKSTKAVEIARERSAVLISEDTWLETLYPNQIRSFDDYRLYSNLIKPLVKSLAQDILTSGSDVVMDFPANTVAQREWLKSISSEIEASHELIYLKVSNATCLEQIAKRRQEIPSRQATDTEEMFQTVTQFFMEPTEDEGFNLTIIDREDQ